MLNNVQTSNTTQTQHLLPFNLSPDPNSIKKVMAMTSGAWQSHTATLHGSWKLIPPEVSLTAMGENIWKRSNDSIPPRPVTFQAGTGFHVLPVKAQTG